MKDYKRILQGVVNIINITKKSDIGFANICAYIDEKCPELAESEDERIRRELISLFADGIKGINHRYTGKDCERWLAWLEKQGKQNLYVNDNAKKMFIKALERVEELNNKGYKLTDCDKNSWWEDFNNYTSCIIEQKSADKVEPKFKVGDWLLYRNAKPFFVEKITKQGYINGDSCLPFNWENEIHLWTIQDAKDGDVLCDYCEEFDNPLIFILKKFERVDFGLVKPSDYSSYCFLTAGDRQIFKEGTYHHEHNIKPATKEQRDLLFKKMHEAGYEWDAEKKELNKIERKSAWSEEDERIKNNISHIIRQYDKMSKKENQPCWYVGDCLLWVQNIKDRVILQQKPVEENNGNNGGISHNSEWSEEDERMRCLIISHFELHKLNHEYITTDDKVIKWLNSFKKSRTKQGCCECDEVDIQAAIEICENAGYDLIANRLKSLRPQNWTKEDKERYVSCLQRLGTGNPKQPETINSKWFKEHVYPQSTWKASDEQMKALADALSLANNCGEENAFDLRTLYEQLKKLREE